MNDREHREAQGSDFTTRRTPLGFIAFKSRQGNGREAFARWHEVCHPVFEVEPKGKLNSFKAAFEFYELSGLVFSHVIHSAAIYRRTRAHLRGGENDFFALQLIFRGREQGEADGRPFSVGPGRIVLRDWARPFNSIAEETEQVRVIIPRERIILRHSLADREPAASWDSQSMQGRILANTLIAVWRMLPEARAEDAPTLASGLLGLLNGLLSPTPEPAGMQALHRASLAAMQAFIEERLWNANLGVDDLVHAFHQSRPVIYRMFRDVGGVRAFIQERRLLRSFRELSAAAQTARPIWQLATQWGFRDPAYFHRAFKSRFGLTAGKAAIRMRAGQDIANFPIHASLPNRNFTALRSWLRTAG